MQARHIQQFVRKKHINDDFQNFVGSPLENLSKVYLLKGCLTTLALLGSLILGGIKLNARCLTAKCFAFKV